jgi:hypothetical protein
MALLGHLVGDAREEPAALVDVRDALAQPFDGPAAGGLARPHGSQCNRTGAIS